MSRLLLLALLVACHTATAPNSRGLGTFELTAVRGLPLPVPLDTAFTVTGGAIELGNAGRFLDVMRYTWMGLPAADSLRGDWTIQGDSLLMFYPYRVASRFDGKTFDQLWGSTSYTYTAPQ